jgi:hypothetical protein
MKTITPRRLCLALLIAAVGCHAHAQSVDSAKLDRVDRGFACPEDLPSDKAREDAIRQFTNDVAAAWPDITIQQMIAFRMAVLERHHCTKALEAIRRHNAEKSG